MKIKFFLLFLLISPVSLLQATPPSEEGKAIFTTRCASCHNVNKILTGPALAGVHERHSIDWIINFVHSSQTMVKKGDKAAVALFEKFNKFPMPDHPDLTTDNIKNIVDYIKTEAKINNGKAPFARPSELRPNYTPISITNYSFFIGFLGLVLVLILVMLFAVEVSAFKRKEKEGQV